MTLKDIETKLTTAAISYPFKLSQSETILDNRFVERHLAYLHGHPKNRGYLSYFNRLEKLAKMV